MPRMTYDVQFSILREYNPELSESEIQEVLDSLFLFQVVYKPKDLFRD